MENNRYVQGQGMYGGIKGTYGRYSVGPRVNNLAAQFNDQMSMVEEGQRRRFKRKRESGYSGAGFWYALYPNMVGAMGSGAVTNEIPNPPKKMSKSKRTTSSIDTMGIGGTTFNGGGAIS